MYWIKEVGWDNISQNTLSQPRTTSSSSNGIFSGQVVGYVYEKGLSRYFTRSPWVVVSITAVEKSVLSKVRFLDLNGMDLSLVFDNHDTQKKEYTYQYWHGEHLLSDPFPPQHNEFSSFLPTPNLHLHHTSKPKDGLKFRWKSRETNIIRLITSHLKPIYVVRHVEKATCVKSSFRAFDFQVFLLPTKSSVILQQRAEQMVSTRYLSTCLFKRRMNQVPSLYFFMKSLTAFHFVSMMLSPQQFHKSKSHLTQASSFINLHLHLRSKSHSLISSHLMI